jgi:hypothetical protein
MHQGGHETTDFSYVQDQPGLATWLPYNGGDGNARSFFLDWILGLAHLLEDVIGRAGARPLPLTSTAGRCRGQIAWLPDLRNHHCRSQMSRGHGRTSHDRLSVIDRCSGDTCRVLVISRLNCRGQLGIAARLLRPPTVRTDIGRHRQPVRTGGARFCNGQNPEMRF